MAMPIVPNTKAGSGIIPGEARTIPTIAVNTINKLTLGLVSSAKSRHPGWDSAAAKQRYRCICSCISRSMGIMLWFK